VWRSNRMSSIIKNVLALIGGGLVGM